METDVITSPLMSSSRSMPSLLPARARSGRESEKKLNAYTLEHICSYAGTLGNSPEVIGPLSEGVRVNFYATRGEVSGPQICGRLIPVAGDWVTVRKDGMAYLDVRTTFETHDAALILVTYQGLIDFEEYGYDGFLRGEVPPLVKLRISPRFVTSHPAYLWLNRLFCVGVGEYRSAAKEVTYDVYAVR
jgi:hypothetical protein